MSQTTELHLNTVKYENAILYFVQNCNNNWLGATKLNKLLYYLDFISYRDREESVTGDVYRHLDKGPVPKKITDILQTLKKQGKVNVKEIPYKSGSKVEFTIVNSPDMDAFDEYEHELLSEICRKFKLWSTDKIVDQTHLESPWLYSKMLDDVDYEYAYDIDIIPSADLAHASR